MNLDDIRELIRLMKDNDIAEVDWEFQGEHVRLKATPPPAPQLMAAPIMPMAPLPGTLSGASAGTASGGQSAQNLATQLQLPAPEGEAAGERGVIIRSPIVGVFYPAPSPDKPPFIAPGDQIEEDTIICIIEAMKVMNEIKAEMRGTLIEMLAEGGQPVEFGQPLFLIEPAE